MEVKEEIVKPDYMTGDVASGLGRLRKRLLDLSKFNRLLNFRYYVRSTLRVVDELPDQLFENLIDGRTFVFDPVPAPKTPNKKLSFFDAHPEQLDTPDQLEKITNAKDIPMPKVESYAKWLGIRTDYELPTPNGIEQSGKHKDTKIQTLLYPKNLEAVAARLTSLSRTAIEETGSNMLFLSFGFLEWTEDDNSDKTFLAPLLLLPVSLERQKKSRDGMFKYALTYSGEDLQANLSLQEKLKEFSLDFPDIDAEGELPEEYFKKVQKVIRNKPGWRIRRHVSLGILQFGKQLLYLDLDLEKWPKNNNITQHELVTRFFSGGEASGLDFAQEYEIDELEGVVSDLPLITEADSSQHSSIVDAIEGRSLVIEGPPGTGKSQTITNMIGCALAKGKKVLFVAEKLAAFEVVRRRLNQAGLGDFTLELHSNKTQKRVMLHDIEIRLKKHGQYQTPREIDLTLQELHKKRDALKEHAKFMHDKISELDQSPYELFHKAARYEREVIAACPEIEKLAKGRDEHFSIDRFIERGDSLKTMLRSLTEIKNTSGSLSQSPWFGVNKEDLRARDKNAITKSFEETVSKLGACNILVKELSTITGKEFENNSVTLEKAIGLKPALSLLPRVTNWHPIRFLQESNNRNLLRNFVSQINEFNGWVVMFKEGFSGADYPNTDHEAAIHKALGLAEVLVDTTTPLCKIKEGIKHAEGIMDDIQCTKQEWSNALNCLNSDQSLSVENIHLVCIAVQQCALAPLDKLKYQADVFDDDIDGILDVIETRQLDLLSRQTSTQSHFTEYSDIHDNSLKSAATILENSGFSRTFSPAWWKARRLYRTLCNKIEPEGKRSRSDWLRFIAAYNQDKSIFEDDISFKETFDHLFKGLDTDTSGLITLRKWYKGIRECFGLGFSVSAKMGNQVLALDSSMIKSLGQLKKIGLCEKGLGSGPINLGVPICVEI